MTWGDGAAARRKRPVACPARREPMRSPGPEVLHSPGPGPAAPPCMETRSNRGLCSLLFGRLGIGSHAGVPTLECRPQILVQDPRTDLQQPMSPHLGPSHLLLLDHPL